MIAKAVKPGKLYSVHHRGNQVYVIAKNPCEAIRIIADSVFDQQDNQREEQ